MKNCGESELTSSLAPDSYSARASRSRSSRKRSVPAGVAPDARNSRF
jgi:hypothetical protein